MKKKVYDVLIIGAGPAGSASAITLAKQGYSVLIIDQLSFPREKVCGDGLVGDSVTMLKKLGIWSSVEPLANKSEKVEIFPTSDSSFILNSPVYTLKREIFDKILLDYAVDCGACFIQLKYVGEVIEVESGYGKHCSFEFADTSSNKYNIKAKYCLIATGCQSFNHLKNYSLNKPGLIAVRGYLKADLKIDHPMVYLFNKKEIGYYWIFPMGQGEYNIGYGTDSYQKVDLKKKVYNLMAEKFPELELSKNSFSLKGAFLNSNLNNSKKMFHDNILFTGEVLGATFPFTGEGIGKALETGILAGEVINSALKNELKGKSPAARFCEIIEKELQLKYKPYRVINSIYRNSYLCKIFFSRLLKNKNLCDTTSKVLSDKINHERFTTRNIFKYLLSKIL